MPFDPNSKDDEIFIQTAIDAALEKVKAEHEADIAGLKAKNAELLSSRIDPTEFKRVNSELEAEIEFSNKVLIESALTEALNKANVSKQFLPAVKAMLASQVNVKTDGTNNRIPTIGDKSLGDFVADWSQGDEGKHYVAAPANSGGGALGGSISLRPSSTMTRSAFVEMSKTNPQGVSQFFRSGGVLTD